MDGVGAANIFCYCVDSGLPKKILTSSFFVSFRFHIFLGGVCLLCVEIKMKTLIFVFFLSKMDVSKSLSFLYQSSKRIKEERRYSFVVER